MKYLIDVNLKRFGLKAVKQYGRFQSFRKKRTMTTVVDIKQFNLYVDGAFRESEDSSTFDAINPSNGQVFAKVANAKLQDTRAAIASAKQTFENGVWSALSYDERGKVLKKIAELIRKNAKEFAELECLDTGKTIKQTTFIDVPTCADTFEYFAGVGQELADVENNIDAPVKSLTVREPIGVVACIIPWNYPLIMAGWKIAPALMAGNSVIFKPSRTASVSCMRLAELIEEAGLPKGVIHFISTNDHEAADKLLTCSKVNKVSFTGGTETGSQVIEKSAKTIKRLTLELGGKSPNIVFADCDIDAAVGGTMSAIFMNQGQMCTAGSRLLIEDKIYDEFLNRLVERTKKIKIGDASSYETDFGPLVSREHRDYVLECIQKAVSKGAKLVCGGKIPEGEEFKQGAYLEPTILTDVDSSMDVVQEEIFGPVLCVMKFSSQDEAIKVANDSKFGLASCVWTKDEQKANTVARSLQCGTVWVNTYGGFYNQASFGGYKRSGFGRELGREGLLEFTQSKHICQDQTPGGKPLVSNWF